MNWVLENKKTIAIVALLMAVFSSGWIVRAWYEDSVAQKIEQVKADVSLIVADKIAGIKVENNTVYAKTVEKISHEIQYQECVQDSTMLQLTNKALTGE